MEITNTIKEIVSPYIPECRYLKEAEAAYPEIKGRFEIPHSFYVKSTGHFNAVEAFICLNQLAYTGFAHFLQEGAIESIGKIPLEDLWGVQLGGCYIVKIEDFAFRKVINPYDFTGQIKVSRPRKFQKPGESKNTYFLPTEFSFQDCEGGNASGKSLLALVLGSSS